MFSQSQFSTPLNARGGGGGLQGLRDGLSPRGPAELFGLGEARTPTSTGVSPSYPTSSPSSPPPGGYQGGNTQHDAHHQVPGHNTGSWSTRADYALSAPSIPVRCLELGPVLNQCPLKELHSIFQTVIERVFGLGTGGRGWSVSTTQRTAHPKEYQAMASFLSSQGPLMSACNRLLSEPYLRFEFPVSRLSAATQKQVESGTLSPFLSTHLTHGFGQLSLNSFEFYMLTFAAYIVQPYTGDNNLVAGESLYPLLLEDYLSYYLPCDGSTPPQLPFHLPAGLSPSPPTDQSQPTLLSTPARKSLLRQPVSPISPTVSQSNKSQFSSMSHPEKTWRSETFINILSLSWLTQFQDTKVPIPVSDTLKIVRMLIKHLHYFANSGGPTDIIPLDQLKRTILPCVKGQIYSVFKYIFSHWPHDTSFRLVLETWLSYIQPWRYTDRGRPQSDTDVSQVDSRWQQFVAENILLYSEVLRLLLPRFFRMDLTSSKNAYMLFRMAKVFSQPGLSCLVQGAESGLDKGTSGGRGPPSVMPSLDISQLGEGVIAAARQNVIELEGPGFRYNLVFGNEFRQLVCDLLANAERAKIAAKETVDELAPAPVPGDKEGTMSALITWFMSSPATSYSQEVEELKKTVHHLTSSINSLAEVFELSLPELGGESPSGSLGRRRLASGGSSPAERRTGSGDTGQVLTPHGRWQIVQGLAKGEVRYTGDPDTRPITNSEVVVLIRMFHQLSLWLNNRYGNKIVEFWARSGLVGRMTRMIITPPATYYLVNKSISGGPPSRKLMRHPARISLRPLGHKKVLFYIAIYFGILRLFGYSLTSSVILLFLLISTCLFVTALFRTVTEELLGATKTSLLDTSDITEFDDKKNQ